MPKPLPEQVFPYLAVGLAKYTEQEQQYPYPPELLYAQHHLSLAMLTSYPATITEFFELCKKPLEAWWPSSTLPDEIDRRFELLTPEGDVSEEVTNYFETSDLPEGIPLPNIQTISDNQLMVKILKAARQAALYDPVVANREYNAVRQYVITTPWTTSEKLRKHFPDLRSFNIEDVGNLYQDSRSVDVTLLYRRSDMPASCYWNCNVCGPLYLHHDRLGSIKPGACEQRCPGMQGWQPLDVSEHSLVLKRGIHLSTHIPGKAELRLYRWLNDEILPAQTSLRQAALWPGIDCYDLQLIFTNNEVWAVDVKDYKDPFALGKHIKRDNRDFTQSDLQWHKWFYVYPLYRERQRPDYQSCVRRITGQLPSHVEILSEKEFKALVQNR
jgi:hypothetical protein